MSKPKLLNEIGNLQELDNGLLDHLREDELDENLVNATNYLYTSSSHSSDKLTAHEKDYVKHVLYGSATGANAKVITFNPAPTAYIEGMSIAFKNVSQNSGAVTLNVNGLGAKSILKSNGTALANGSLKANSVYTVRYNGTAFILQGEGGEYGTAQPQHVLSAYTIGTEDGLKTGTIINQGGARTIVPSRTNQTLTSGYYSGNVTVQGSSNLLASNIRSGVNIFGVVGNVAVSTGGREAYTEVGRSVSSDRYRINLSITLNAGFPIIAYAILIANIRTGSYKVNVACVNHKTKSGTFSGGNLLNASTDRGIIGVWDYSFISGNTLYGDVGIESEYGFPSQDTRIEAIGWG